MLRNLGITHADKHVRALRSRLVKPFTKIIIGLHHATTTLCRTDRLRRRNKNDRLLETFLPREKSRRARALVRYQVDSCRSVDMPVYDIQTESGTFLTRNVVVHNCFILGSKTISSTKAAFSTASFAKRVSLRAAPAAARTSRSSRAAGEKLTGGGTSSGLCRSSRSSIAPPVPSSRGGTTRRAAKMVVLNADHPDIEEFVNWKVREERKVADMVIGLAMFERHLNADHLGSARYARTRDMRAWIRR